MPVGAKVAQATVTEKAGRWYVSVQIEQECGEIEAGSGPALGIDLDIKHLATCSDARRGKRLLKSEFQEPFAAASRIIAR